MKRNKIARHRAIPRSPHRIAGFALLEALVSVVVFSLSIVALVTLYANLTRAQGAAKYRSDAAELAAEVVGSVWTDQANASKYTAGQCSGYGRCSDWLAKVKTTLPEGSARFGAVAAGELEVTIQWTSKSDGTHTYVTRTFVGY